MAEPSTTGTTLGGAALLAALGGVMGPLMAEWAVVLLGAFIGAIVAVGELETVTLRSAWWVMVRGLGLAVIVTGTAAELIAPYIGLGAPALLLAIAGLIGWRQTRLLADARALWPIKKG